MDEQRNGMSNKERPSTDDLPSAQNDVVSEGNEHSLSEVLESIQNVTQRLERLNSKVSGNVVSLRLAPFSKVRPVIQKSADIAFGNHETESEEEIRVSADHSKQSMENEEEIYGFRRGTDPEKVSHVSKFQDERTVFVNRLRQSGNNTTDYDNRVVFKDTVTNVDQHHKAVIAVPNIFNGRVRNIQTEITSTGQVTGTPSVSPQPMKFVEEQFWHDLVQIEIQQGRRCRDARERGMDTILCIDISDSMKGRPWEQAMEFSRGFVHAVQRNTKMREIVFEHLGVVVFGHETKVVQHMTVDYVEVLRKLDTLHPGGPTPLFGGIHMCGAVSFGAGERFSCQNILMNPRILLITDGHLTKRMMVSGPDILPLGEDAWEKAAVCALAIHLRSSIKFDIYPVPVGNADLCFLDMLANTTNGKIIPSDKWVQTARYFKNVQIAGRASGLDHVQKILFEPLTIGDTKVHSDQLWVPAVQMAEGASDEDMEEVKEILKNNKAKDSDDDADDDDNDGGEYKERFSSLPNLGTRVRRGKNWKWGNQDCNSTGTIVNHIKHGIVRVVWDKSAEGCNPSNAYRYDDEEYDVEVVDDPKILTDELIAVGCVVKRGVDWRYTDQDGGEGNTGVVIGVGLNGIVCVRWSHGHIKKYRFGDKGKFEVEVCNPVKERQQTLDTEKKTKRTPVSNKNKLIDSGEDMDTENSDTVDKNNLTGDENELVRIERLNIMNLRNIQITKTNETSTDGNRVSGTQSEVPPDVKAGTDDYTWQWKASDGSWKFYPPGINDILEENFQKNPKSSKVIYIGNETYRIIFNRMQQMDIKTKVCTDIQRLSTTR